MTIDRRGLAQRFALELPNARFLDLEDPEGLTGYLRGQAWLAADETVHKLERAGEGNMNLVVRVHADNRSFVIKQCRPWVEKYPQIAAPADRVVVEARFYEVVGAVPDLERRMPRVFGFDRRSRVLAMQDLGVALDYTDLYRDGSLDDSSLGELLTYLSALHRVEPPKDDPLLSNRAMRRLNHEHIFDLPLRRDNGLDLDAFTPGLRQAARALSDDQRYVAGVRALGEVYLSDGSVLLHGDYYPGSWVRAGGRPFVLDPEFCFAGRPEFDLGVMLAHLELAQQGTGCKRRVLSEYAGAEDLRIEQALGFMGAEIMRRLLGVAQLPIETDLEQKRAWLELSRNLVLDPRESLVA